MTTFAAPKISVQNKTLIRCKHLVSISFTYWQNMLSLNEWLTKRFKVMKGSLNSLKNGFSRLKLDLWLFFFSRRTCRETWLISHNGHQRGPKERKCKFRWSYLSPYSTPFTNMRQRFHYRRSLSQRAKHGVIQRRDWLTSLLGNSGLISPFQEDRTAHHLFVCLCFSE